MARTDSPAQPQLAFIGIGSNLPGTFADSLQLVVHAIAHLAANPCLEIAAQSSLYRSAPIDTSGPDFINAVIKIQTTLEPLPLLDLLQQVEQKFARQRPFPNAPRTLDLDLLVWGDTTLNTPRLTLPHPRMTERAFVVRPLCEIAPLFALSGRGNVQEWRDNTLAQRVDQIAQRTHQK